MKCLGGVGRALKKYLGGVGSVLFASPDVGVGTALFVAFFEGNSGGDGVLYLSSVTFANLMRRGVVLCFGFAGFCFAGVRGVVGVWMFCWKYNLVFAAISVSWKMTETCLFDLSMVVRFGLLSPVFGRSYSMINLAWVLISFTLPTFQVGATGLSLKVNRTIAPFSILVSSLWLGGVGINLWIELRKILFQVSQMSLFFSNILLGNIELFRSIGPLKARLLFLPIKRRLGEMTADSRS